MRIGYARVSTKEQSLDSQVDALKLAACDKVFSEVTSGAKTQRPVLEELLAHLRKGDVLVIYKPKNANPGSVLPYTDEKKRDKP